MNNRKAKIIVDILMVIFVILSFVRWYGNNGFLFHGIVGTIFSLLAATHLFLNRKWLVAVTKNMKARKANRKTKMMYLVDILLILFWGIVIITGYLAIPAFTHGNESFEIFSRIHGVFSRIGAGLILLHVIQHLGHIRSYIGIKKNKIKTA